MKPTAGNNFMNPDFAPRARFPEQEFPRFALGRGLPPGLSRMPPGQTKFAEKKMPLQGLASGALEAFRNMRGRGAGNFMKSIGPQVSDMRDRLPAIRGQASSIRDTLNYMNPAPPMNPALGGTIPGTPGGMNAFSAREKLRGFNPNFGNVVSGEMRPQSRDMTQVPKLKFKNPATRKRNWMEEI